MNIFFKFSQSIRFLLTGGVNTLVGYLIYVLTFKATQSYSFALSVSTVLGVIFNYVTYARFTFSARRTWLSAFRFVAAYAVTFLLNLELLHIGVDMLGFSAVLAQVFCLPLSVIFSYLLLKLWVFKG